MSETRADTDDPSSVVTAKGYKAKVRYLNAENLRILDSENQSDTRDHASVHPFPGDEVLHRERPASLLSDG